MRLLCVTKSTCSSFRTIETVDQPIRNEMFATDASFFQSRLSVAFKKQCDSTDIVSVSFVKVSLFVAFRNKKASIREGQLTKW